MKTSFTSRALCSITCLAFAFEEKLRVNMWSEGQVARAWRRPVAQRSQARGAAGRAGQSEIVTGTSTGLALAIGADQFFIEAPFLHADVKVAAERRLGPLSRPRGQASKRGGTSLPHEVQTLMESRSFVCPPGLVRLRRVPNPLVPLVAAQRWRHSLLHAPESHTANAGPIRRGSRSRALSWPGTTDVHKANPCGHEHC
jgi:hypothetical protein